MATIQMFGNWRKSLKPSHTHAPQDHIQEKKYILKYTEFERTFNEFRMQMQMSRDGISELVWRESWKKWLLEDSARSVSKIAVILCPFASLKGCTLIGG